MFFSHFLIALSQVANRTRHQLGTPDLEALRELAQREEQDEHRAMLDAIALVAASEAAAAAGVPLMPLAPMGHHHHAPAPTSAAVVSPLSHSQSSVATVLMASPFAPLPAGMSSPFGVLPLAATDVPSGSVSSGLAGDNQPSMVLFGESMRSFAMHLLFIYLLVYLLLYLCILRCAVVFFFLFFFFYSYYSILSSFFHLVFSFLLFFFLIRTASRDNCWPS